MTGLGQHTVLVRRRSSCEKVAKQLPESIKITTDVEKDCVAPTVTLAVEASAKAKSAKCSAHLGAQRQVTSVPLTLCEYCAACRRQEAGLTVLMPLSVLYALDYDMPTQKPANKGIGVGRDGLDTRWLSACNIKRATCSARRTSLSCA